MVREFNCSNVNGYTIVVREESLKNIIVIYDVVSGHFVHMDLDKGSVNLKNVLEYFAHNHLNIDYSLAHEGQVLTLEYDKSIKSTKLIVEDRKGNSMYMKLTPIQFNTLVEFTRHAISAFNTSDNSFYLNVYTQG